MSCIFVISALKNALCGILYTPFVVVVDDIGHKCMSMFTVTIASLSEDGVCESGKGDEARNPFLMMILYNRRKKIV